MPAASRAARRVLSDDARGGGVRILLAGGRLEDHEYSERLVRLQEVRWKQLLRVQAPYRWSLRRLQLGFTLELGCGMGRNLAHLNENAVGVDLNPFCVAEARGRGFRAFTPADFAASQCSRLRASRSCCRTSPSPTVEYSRTLEVVAQNFAGLQPS